ncbi:MAG: prepilin peptidase [Verrucomicrobiales bacterium]
MSDWQVLLTYWWGHPAGMWAVIALGACIGSFLNVAIYRLPLGLSVNEPKRSFCPLCKAALPWWQNLPLITWLVQRGKCAHCAAPIPFRYFLVELLTALLFWLCWYLFPPLSGLLMMILCGILVTVSFIDAEHQIIPIHLTWGGSILAVLSALLLPESLHLLEDISRWERGKALAFSVMGWAAGFGSLWFVVLLGKLIFGTLKLEFAEARPWHLAEPQNDNEQLRFVIGEEAYDWGELFYRKSDVLEIEGHGILVDGKRTKVSKLRIFADHIEFGERCVSIADLKSLKGKAERVRIPREAMGMGDPHLLAMCGAFLGWPAVLFTILASSLYAIAAALIARVGFGRPLPYGPFLALGALTWVFGGWQWWNAYLRLLERGW